MKRADIISTVGREYLIGNIENDEFSYPKAYREVSLPFVPIQSSGGGSRTFEKLDMRFVKDNVSVLIETKADFTKDIVGATEQLSAYVEYEKQLTGNKVVAILANTTNNDIKVWRAVVSDGDFMQKEIALRTIDEYVDFYTSKINDKEKVMANTYRLNELLHLHGISERLRKSVVDEIRDMSYNPKEAEISIISSLMEKQIFQNNTIVKYRHNDTLLPEDYNGLGYLNLFAIMFDIRIKLDGLSKKNNKDEKPTPINLLFIEEPEAHTHPQMQYVFITNIKKVLEKQRADITNFSLQTIISTHSAHIVSQCDFQDIVYFSREPVAENSAMSKSLKKLYTVMVTEAVTETEKYRRIEQEHKRKEQEQICRMSIY